MSKKRKFLGYTLSGAGYVLTGLQFLTIYTGQIASMRELYSSTQGGAEAIGYIAGGFISILIGYYLVLFGRKVLKKKVHWSLFLAGPAIWIIFLACLFIFFNTHSKKPDLNQSDTSVLQNESVRFEDMKLTENSVIFYYTVKGLAFFVPLQEQVQEEFISTVCGNKELVKMLEEDNLDVKYHYQDEITEEKLVLKMKTSECEVL